MLDLEQFREKTPMYIGDWKISSLNAFLSGYFFAVQFRDLGEHDDVVEFGEFHDWTANYFGWKESTAGWKNIILKECGGDEEAALAKFFELYDIFKVRKKDS